jgi:DNA-binding NarL/FixJ family response regulator
VTIEAALDDAADAPPIRIVIADDQRLVRAGFAVILNSEPGISVVGEANDGAEAVALAAELAPDVVLLDIQMPVMDGLAAARRILATEGPRVLMLSTFGTDDYVYEALRIGASGFLLKDAPADQLITAIRCVAAGDALIDPTITKRLISQFARIPRPSDGVPEALSTLTSRELDVMRLIARGLSNAEIASELVVEDSTVKTHVKRVLMKLGLRDRVQVVVLAYETGFVVPDR